MTFDEIAQDKSTSNAHGCGLLPSAADIAADDDGGRQVLHTRFKHAGGGRIVNPESGASGPQVNVEISDVRALKRSARHGSAIMSAATTASTATYSSSRPTRSAPASRPR